MRRILSKLLKIGTAVAVVLAFTLGVSAESVSPEDYIKDFEEIVPEGSEGELDGDGVLSSSGFDALLGELAAALSGGVRRIFPFFLMLSGFALLLSLASLSGELLPPELSSAMSASAAALVTFSVWCELSSLTVEIREVLSSLSDFFGAAAPILAGITASGGAVGCAAAEALNMSIALTVTDKILTGLLLPVVMLMFSLSLVSLSGDAGSVISSGARSVFGFILGAVSVILLAATGMQTLLAGSRDTLALRAVKYAVTGTVPIVSGTVSGAFSALSASVAHASATVGTGSVLVILSIALSPLMLLLLYRLSLGAAIGFMNFVGAKGAASPFVALRSALDMLTAVFSVSILIYIIEIAIVMKCGVSLFG